MQYLFLGPIGDKPVSPNEPEIPRLYQPPKNDFRGHAQCVEVNFTPSLRFRSGSCSWGQTLDTSTCQHANSEKYQSTAGPDSWYYYTNCQSKDKVSLIVIFTGFWVPNSNESKLPRKSDVIVTIATTTTEISHGCIAEQVKETFSECSALLALILHPQNTEKKALSDWLTSHCDT